MPLKILVGPHAYTSGSHHFVTDLPGMPVFHEPAQMAAAVAEHRPDAVLLRAAGHNGVSPADIMACPVPVIGVYHDWPCWTSIRLDAVAATHDWLITEKTAVAYLQNMGHLNKSHYLLMSREGIERVHQSGIRGGGIRPIDASFLGSFFVNGYRNPFRLRDTSPTAQLDNLYWSRLGFRDRSTMVALLARYPANVYVAAQTRERPGLKLDPANPSLSVMAQSKICVHIDAGRKHAANRCFEAMALGCLLFLEDDNELFDFLPAGAAVAFNAGNLYAQLDHYLSRPAEMESIAKTGQAWALQHFTNAVLSHDLVLLIESVLPVLRDRPDQRGDLYEHYRAPVHWEGTEVHHAKEAIRDLGAVAHTWLGANEAAVFWFDVWQKTNQTAALENAIDHMEAVRADANAGPSCYWNMAVMAENLKQPQLAEQAMGQLERSLGNANADFRGSRLEIQKDWWLSGHIEHALALKKIGGRHAELERSAMQWRLGMLRGDRDAFWDELPDEHKRNGDLDKVRELDPLDNPSRDLSARIEDLKAETFGVEDKTTIGKAPANSNGILSRVTRPLKRYFGR